MAYHFDANAEDVVFGVPSDWTWIMDLGTEPQFTMSIWARLTTSEPGVLMTLLNTEVQLNAQAGFYWCLDDRSGKDHRFLFELSKGPNSTGRIINGGADNQFPKDTDWHHCLIRYDQDLGSNNLEFMVDGSSVGTNTKSGTSPAASQPLNALHVGNEPGFDLFEWLGDLAEVAFWQNYWLTDDEVMALANGASPLHVARGSLRHYFPLWGNHSSEIDLMNVNNLTGTVSGCTSTDHAPVLAPWWNAPSVAQLKFDQEKAAGAVSAAWSSEASTRSMGTLSKVASAVSAAWSAEEAVGLSPITRAANAVGAAWTVLAPATASVITKTASAVSAAWSARASIRSMGTLSKVASAVSASWSAPTALGFLASITRVASAIGAAWSSIAPTTAAVLRKTANAVGAGWAATASSRSMGALSKLTSPVDVSWSALTGVRSMGPLNRIASVVSAAWSALTSGRSMGVVTRPASPVSAAWAGVPSAVSLALTKVLSAVSATWTAPSTSRLMGAILKTMNAAAAAWSALVPTTGAGTIIRQAASVGAALAVIAASRAMGTVAKTLSFVQSNLIAQGAVITVREVIAGTTRFAFESIRGAMFSLEAIVGPMFHFETVSEAEVSIEVTATSRLVSESLTGPHFASELLI